MQKPCGNERPRGSAQFAAVFVRVAFLQNSLAGSESLNCPSPGSGSEEKQKETGLEDTGAITEYFCKDLAGQRAALLWSSWGKSTMRFGFVWAEGNRLRITNTQQNSLPRRFLIMLDLSKLLRVRSWEDTSCCLLPSLPSKNPRCLR